MMNNSILTRMSSEFFEISSLGVTGSAMNFEISIVLSLTVLPWQLTAVVVASDAPKVMPVNLFKVDKMRHELGRSF